MRILIASLILALLAACGSNRTVEDYVPPSSMPPEAVATLVGSRIFRQSDFEGDMRVSLSSIDGKRVNLEGGTERWRNEMAVPPGLHEIGIHAYRGGMLGGTSAWGIVDVTLEAGERYTIRSTYPDRDMAETWIENSAGERVSTKAHLAMQAGAPTTVIFLP